MKKLFKNVLLLTALVSVSVLSSAQNLWNGSTISTTTLTGKVGIGTLSPETNLHIHSATNYVENKFRMVASDNYMGFPNQHHYEFVVRPRNSSGGGNCFELRQAFTSTLPAVPQFTTILKFEGTYMQIARLEDIQNNSYYLDPANTSISLKVAGKIQACGKIEAQEIEVKNVCAANINVKMDNLADFVFKPEYKLASLNEVESFITENNHLPNMPSAQSVKENGMNVAEMNNLLLQKVEELTLYMVELNKQLQESKKEIELLKK